MKMQMNKLSTISYVTNGKLRGDCVFTGFSIDSRKVEKGDIFVCLKGARVDGHEFIRDAENAGAVGFICEKDLDTNLPYIKVPSSLAALQQYASYYRDSLDITLVAVTGSVGKTTTKECIYSVLREKFKTHKTFGNMNSETGLPLTILDIEETDEIAVTEMGMSAAGEIKVLSDIARPDIAVITNIGLSHIEYLGSQENILKAKLEILSGLKDDGVLIINYDDEYLKHGFDDLLKDKIPQTICRYGINNGQCDVYAQDIVMEDDCLRFYVNTPIGGTTIIMPCEGVHNVYNALAAITVAINAGAELKDISSGLYSFKNVPLRQQTYTKLGFNVIEDCYNASPASVEAAIEVLRRKKGRRIAVLGDMKELGDFSESLHMKTGKLLNGIDILIAFGNYNSHYIEGAIEAGLSENNCYDCKTAEDAASVLFNIAEPGDYILVKSSRSMNGEKILSEFFDKHA